MDRLRALATIGAATACGFFPARAGAATATIRMGSGLTDSSILTEVAQSLGLLERAGIAADIQFIPNGPATMAAMLGGSIDVGGSNSLSFLQARDKGLPLKIVAAQAVYRTNLEGHTLRSGRPWNPVQVSPSARFDGARIATRCPLCRLLAVPR
jgi:ABC-type nitrate/sulfonate/bicarbonate transport system substrate-binding protein